MGELSFSSLFSTFSQPKAIKASGGLVRPQQEGALYSNALVSQSKDKSI